jgi:hypothetical protein
MGERQLSNKAIHELQQSDDKIVRFFRSCIRRGKMHKVETRKKDRRVAINSCVAPEMERRSGYDRRR